MSSRPSADVAGGTPDAEDAPAANGAPAVGRPENPLVDELVDWLMASALRDTTVAALFRGCCERLHAADVPLWRGALGFRTLHPLFRAVSLVWYRGRELEIVEHPHGEGAEAGFRGSPQYHLIQHELPLLRRRLEGASPNLDFPLLEELRAAGASDYLAFIFPFGDRQADPVATDGLVGSWASDRPGGFSDDDIRVLRRVQRRLAVACKVSVKDTIARNILDAYLGPHSGRQVYEGRIRRGSGERIHAVIWFSDLRGSTALSKELSTQDFLAVLNAFFEAVADVVLDRGGEVLRFIGDAVLAIFPMEGHAPADWRTCPVHQAACRTALAAAREAIARVDALNARRIAATEKPLRFGIGLHVGDVMYGNIGVPRRVEFSVVGHAANYAAKLEALCKVLDVPLVVSERFAGIHREDWMAMGEQIIDGGAAEPVFSLPELAAGVAARP